MIWFDVVAVLMVYVVAQVCLEHLADRCAPRADRASNAVGAEKTVDAAPETKA